VDAHLHSRVRNPQSDQKRFAGVGLLFVGSAMLTLSLFFMATLQSAGVPRTTTELRALLFGLLGLTFALAGYRVASGTWAGSLQVPHRAAALAGVLFLGYFVKLSFHIAAASQLPSAWLFSLAVLAIISWLFAACRRRAVKNRH
jgi:hypothetical protein